MDSDGASVFCLEEIEECVAEFCKIDAPPGKMNAQKSFVVRKNYKIYL